jgi:uncharacterized membrane protein
MILLLLGLIIFLGAHSVRIYADDWRSQQIARLGEKKWKGAISLASLLGLVLIIHGFGEARMDPVVLWQAPVWARHSVPLLTLPAFMLIVAGSIPGNRIKQKIGHPMVAGTGLWAFSHLLANGRLAGVLLFGAFTAWALVDFIAARRRDKLAGTVYPEGTMDVDRRVLIFGFVGWLAFVLFLHSWLIGVRPYG